MTRTSQPGSRLVEELGLLFDAVAERAGPWLDRVVSGGHDEHAGLFGDARGGCPLCALAALLPGEPAELAARGLDRVADLVALLRAVLADRWEPGVVHMPGFAPPPGQREPDPAAGLVQRIPVRRKDNPN